MLVGAGGLIYLEATGQLREIPTGGAGIDLSMNPMPAGGAGADKPDETGDPPL